MMRPPKFLPFLLILGAVGGCATASAPERVAALRALEAESAARLALEGETLFEKDPEKRTGYQYCSLAVGLLEQGELRRGIREASKALFLGEQSRDEYLLANAKRDLAYAYSLAGHLERAAGFAEEAISHTYRASPHADRAAVLGPAYKIRGDVRLRQNRVSEAVKDYEQALALGHASFQPFVRASLGNAYLAGGNPAKAREWFDRAEAGAGGSLRPLIRRGLGNVALVEGRHAEAARLFTEAVDQSGGPDQAYHRLWALEGLARARRAAGDQAAAIRAYREAIAGAEQVRARFRSEEFKTGFFGEVQRIFDESVSLLMEAGEPEAAFEVSERSRARALLDLVRGRVKVSAGTEAFADPVRQVASSREVQAALPQGTAVVVYHVLPSRTHVWVIRQSGITPVVLEVSRAALVERASQFRDAIRTRSTRALEIAVDLYERLIRPLPLSRSETLIVVPHDVLHYVPFQALRGSQGYLVEERAISYAPSASTLVDLLKLEQGGRRHVLALGNPDLGTPRLALPGAEREVARIKTLFPEAEVFIRRDATKERVVARAPVSQVVHLATHAEVDEIDPLYSVIRLAPTEKVPGDLEAHEVYRMDLTRTDLVSLSACDTGLGRVSRGDELWGFTRAFLSAGVPALLVSLWPVEDESTARLMGRFYEELRRDTANRALRAAQLEVLGTPASSHPFFWAPFILVGDWR